VEARRIAAVVFDLGGVVLGSPLHAIARFERERAIPEGFVNRLVVASGPSGAWARLERGELELEAFAADFEAECARSGCRMDARVLMERIAESAQPRPAMLAALARIRERGLRTAALTNNWVGGSDASRGLRGRFDVFVESSTVGLRKPDPRIFAHAQSLAHAQPHECLFIDDIPANVEAAKACGWRGVVYDRDDDMRARLTEAGVRFAPAR